MQTLVAVSKREAVQSAVDEVVAALAPSVIHIRFNFGEDWSGDSAIYFRVLLSDEASKDEHRHPVARRARQKPFRTDGLE